MRTHRMRVACFALVVAVVAGVARGQGVDRVHRHTGIDSGQITGVSALQITLSRNGVEKRIPAHDVDRVQLAGQPQELGEAQVAIQSGRYDQALQKLLPIATEKFDRPEIDQEVAFDIALCRGRLALAGQTGIEEGRSAVNSFLRKHRTSFHVPEAIELSGDLELAAGDAEAARAQYELLGRPRDPYYRLRSALLLGRAYQADGDHDAAVEQFAKVLAAPGDAGAELTRAATLQNAVSLAATGKLDRAVEDVRGVIAAAGGEDVGLLARAYNVLGDCYREADDAKSALFAYLHVDLVYGAEQQQRARALYELVGLWEELGKPDRSRETAERLQEDYPKSPWAAKL